MSGEIISSIISAVATVGAAFWIYILSRKYSEHTRKLEHAKMLKDLFKEFNERYDKIKNDLEDIVEHPAKHLNSHSTVFTFFNICSEEYYWHKEGRLDDKIWRSWSTGMNDIYRKSKLIKDMWDVECEQEGYRSYYIAKPDEFFKKLN